MRVDEDGTPVIDEPLLSPKRIINAVRMKLYFMRRGADNVSLKNWLLYFRRPYASHKKGVY